MAPLLLPLLLLLMARRHGGGTPPVCLLVCLLLPWLELVRLGEWRQWQLLRWGDLLRRLWEGEAPCLSAELLAG